MTSKIKRLTVTSKARTYTEMVRDLESQGIVISSNAKKVLERPSALSLRNRQYNLVIISGATVMEVHSYAMASNFMGCTREVALLVREQLATKEAVDRIGFKTLVAMHKPIRFDSIESMMRLFVGASPEQGDCFIGAWNSIMDDHPTMGRLPEGRGLIYVENVVSL